MCFGVLSWGLIYLVRVRVYFSNRLFQFGLQSVPAQVIDWKDSSPIRPLVR